MRTSSKLRRELSCLPALLLLLATTFFASFSAFSQEAAPTETATVISAVPFTITKPGVYVLKSNLVFKSATGSAIAVAASANDVTIDLGGHVLSNGALADDNNKSMGILISGSGTLAIRNGGLRGFLYGVTTSGANQTSNANQTGILIDGITCIGCGWAGISLALSGDIIIRNCLIQNTGYKTSVQHRGVFASAHIVHMSDCRILNTISSNATGQYVFGIYTTARYTVVSNCLFDGEEADNNTYGIYFSGNGVATGNSISRSEYGIYVNGVTVKYMNNITMDCTTAFSGGTSVGTNN